MKEDIGCERLFGTTSRRMGEVPSSEKEDNRECDQTPYPLSIQRLLILT